VTPFERAREYWAVRLGCARGSLVLPGLTLVAPGEQGFAFVLRSGDSIVAVAPESLHAALSEVAPETLLTPEGLLPFLPAGARLIGPAIVAYLEGAHERPEGVVLIESVHDPRLEALRAAVLPEEWRQANLEQAEMPIFACEHQDRIGAVAGFQRVQDRIAHLGVISDPRSRERGLGRRVTQAAAARALALELLPQFQTLASNAGALRIGAQLGFVPFATTLAARWEPS
jgi:acetyltransferase (GNAT) family protein